jgi:hypothetical protein
MEKSQLRGNNTMGAVAYQLLCGRAPAQIRGNIVVNAAEFSGLRTVTLYVLNVLKWFIKRSDDIFENNLK